MVNERLTAMVLHSSYCWAGLYVAGELLRAEGFTDVRYLEADSGRRTEDVSGGPASASSGALPISAAAPANDNVAVNSRRLCSTVMAHLGLCHSAQAFSSRLISSRKRHSVPAAISALGSDLIMPTSAGAAQELTQLLLKVQSDALAVLNDAAAVNAQALGGVAPNFAEMQKTVTEAMQNASRQVTAAIDEMRKRMTDLQEETRQAMGTGKAGSAASPRT